jgi:hypothetical protein
MSMTGNSRETYGRGFAYLATMIGDFTHAAHDHVRFAANVAPSVKQSRGVCKVGGR